MLDVDIFNLGITFCYTVQDRIMPWKTVCVCVCVCVCVTK